MTGTTNEAVSDALNCLMDVSRDRLQPDEARARLCAVQVRHPGIGMDLVWHEQSYDRSLHYDVLVRLSHDATVSLSYCADHALPWPLRGVHRWSDRDLVRVNGEVLTVPQAIASLDFIWTDESVIGGLISMCLLREENGREPVRISEVDLQRGMDAFRRAQRLYTVEATEAWMQERGMTPVQLEALVADKLVLAALRERITAGRVEAYFDAHRASFDAVQVAAINYADEVSARHAFRQLQTGELDFFAAAQAQFVARREGRAPAEVPLFREIRRSEAAEEMRDALFAATPGALVGPLHAGEQFTMYRIVAFVPAHLDTAERAEIERMLFDTWQEERRRSARIEWNYGTADLTSDAGAR